MKHLLALITIALLAVGGCCKPLQSPCRVTIPPTTKTAPRPVTEPQKAPTYKCSTIGEFMGATVGVIIRQNCIYKGSATLAVLVLGTGPDAFSTALKEAAPVIYKILGFMPTLQLYTETNVKGKPLMVFKITGVYKGAPPVKEDDNDKKSVQ